MHIIKKIIVLIKKKTIIKCIDILENNNILGEKIDNANTLLDLKYQFSPLEIRDFVNNSAKIPLDYIETLFDIPTSEFKERTNRLEILGFYISNELIRYIKNI